MYVTRKPIAKPSSKWYITDISLKNVFCGQKVNICISLSIRMLKYRVRVLPISNQRLSLIHRKADEKAKHSIARE